MQDYKLNRISVAYSSEEPIKRILDNVTLSVRQGEWLTIVGKNGSGKSTLARVIAGLLPISSGHIERGWTDGDGSGEVPIRMVLQHPESQLIGETVDEDIRFTLETAGVPSTEWENRLVRALEAVGLLEERTSVTAALSGGQKQLLAVAGCIAAQARLIVFDEASSMLDGQSRDRLLEAARELHGEGVTILWVTHALEELAVSDRVLALREGRLVFSGDVRAFFYEGSEDAGTANVKWPSPCERLGFELPFAVKAAMELKARGVFIEGQPLTWDALRQELEVLFA